MINGTIIIICLVGIIITIKKTLDMFKGDKKNDT